ncbi:isochorismatase family protein [Reyranella sp.]|jgi:nicotinamidase-related amidase|uniref:isochorismatase family protein n=1 Tax=Reyranella sp. TaxID=1929291 RepID=UPI002633F33B|nr:isochorismatase family protein [Reyranella sp.]HQS16402.1 isochorismatase family protein [Reyranella sp.]HQT12233.1 isochorismatase family protein [Reyranella sp.]
MDHFYMLRGALRPLPEGVANPGVLSVDGNEVYTTDQDQRIEHGDDHAADGRGAARAGCAGRAAREGWCGGTPIVHVRHQSKGMAFNQSSAGYEIVKELTPRDGETIIDKGMPNSFAGTDLASRLAAIGRKNLIVGGFMTHMCVSATVRAATDQGFMSTIAADTVATRDLPDATGGDTIAADVINRITLAALSDRFAWIVPSARQIA